MRQLTLFLLLVICLLLSSNIIHAQGDSGACAVNSNTVLEQVGTVCSAVSTNEICYGNDQVSIVTSEDAPDLDFNQPGELARLSSIRSLFLSEVNAENNTWGVAQLRLLVNQGNGLQDVTMLLFGDVELENQDETLVGIATTINGEAQVFPVAPSRGFSPTATLDTGTMVEAIGRLNNNVWVQIVIPDTDENGWVFRSKLDLTDTAIDGLRIKDGDAPLFGSMQAFTFQSGTSPNCTTTVADGLLIQTPQGMARVSFLINEVTVELTSAGNGASAFIQANPNDGAMNVNVLDGTAYVSAGPHTQQVDAGYQTSIPINSDMRPNGEPSNPDAFNPDTIRSIPLLPIVRDPNRDFIPDPNPQVSRSDAIEANDETLVVSSNNNNQGNDGGGSDGSNGSGTGNQSSSGQGTSTDSGDTTGNGNGTTGDDTSEIPPTATEIPTSSPTQPSTTDTLALYLRLGLIGGLLVLGIGLVVWSVYYYWRSHK